MKLASLLLVLAGCGGAVDVVDGATVDAAAVPCTLQNEGAMSCVDGAWRVCSSARAWEPLSARPCYACTSAKDCADQLAPEFGMSFSCVTGGTCVSE